MKGHIIRFEGHGHTDWGFWLKVFTTSSKKGLGWLCPNAASSSSPCCKTNKHRAWKQPTPQTSRRTPRPPPPSRRRWATWKRKYNWVGPWTPRRDFLLGPSSQPQCLKSIPKPSKPRRSQAAFRTSTRLLSPVTRGQPALGTGPARTSSFPLFVWNTSRGFQPTS